MDKRKVCLQGGLQRILNPIHLQNLPICSQFSADSSGGQNASQASATGSDALGHCTLGPHSDLNPALLELFLDRPHSLPGREGADQPSNPPLKDEPAKTDIFHSCIITDDHQVLDAFAQYGLHKLDRMTREAESTHHQGRPITNVRHSSIHLRDHFIQHA